LEEKRCGRTSFARLERSEGAILEEKRFGRTSFAQFWARRPSGRAAIRLTGSSVGFGAWWLAMGRINPHSHCHLWLRGAIRFLGSISSHGDGGEWDESNGTN
jgi:hypothetical protein